MTTVAMTIGNFDGVHKGHQSLIARLEAWKSKQGGGDVKSVVVTFEPHPRAFLNKGSELLRLCSPEEKESVIKSCGVDEVAVFKFDADLAKLSPEDFFSLLCEKYSIEYLLVGSNFYFAKDRSGSPQKLAELALANNIESEIFDPVSQNGSFVSSSRIREYLSSGEVKSAAKLLGRSFSLSSEVKHGQNRGAKFGFPTANTSIPRFNKSKQCIPQRGVYLTQTQIEGLAGFFPSVTNIGFKPTVSQDSEITIETHLLDFDQDLYGKMITVEFLDRLRDEQKFASVDQLKLQISKDIDKARELLRKQ